MNAIALQPPLPSTCKLHVAKIAGETIFFDSFYQLGPMIYMENIKTREQKHVIGSKTVEWNYDHYPNNYSSRKMLEKQDHKKIVNYCSIKPFLSVNCENISISSYNELDEYKLPDWYFVTEEEATPPQIKEYTVNMEKLYDGILDAMAGDALINHISEINDKFINMILRRTISTDINVPWQYDYINNWLKNNSLSEEQNQRINKIVDEFIDSDSEEISAREIINKMKGNKI